MLTSIPLSDGIPSSAILNSSICHFSLYSHLQFNSIQYDKLFDIRFFPEKATALAVDILNELVEVLKIRPCPLVFASFSGGSKACMLKILQIINGTSEAHNMQI